MIRRRIAVSLLSVFLIFQLFSVTGCSKKEVKIYGNDNEILASINTILLDKTKLEDEGIRSYLEIVLEETMDRLGITEEQLFQEQYAIYTSFDKKVYQSLKEAYETYQDQKMSFGCAVTDVKGNLIATYSAGDFEEQYINYAKANTPPYAALEPLSVYAPAIEKGIASWSKTYMDSSFKQIVEEDGGIRDWPANASDSYSNENVTVCEALKVSLNTVAVKCLKEYGVQNSIQYLKDSFDISLSYEESRIQTMGEDEMIGNVALGYLYEGVSPVDMAGYYQTFASGGIYEEPKTVTKICDSEGKTLYELEQEGKAVLNYETAFIMNHLLQEIITKGGTGEDARCETVLVGGKTGSGSAGNWFVGFTPEYTCAVWHGKEIAGNHAPELFRNAVSEFQHDDNADFLQCGTIQKAAYCKESGKLISGKCKKVDKGYYTSVDTTERCNEH